MSRQQDNQDRVEQTVKIWLSADWDIKEETPDYYEMTKNTQTTWGHIWVFLFTFWWTLGLGNLLYWAVSKKSRRVYK